MFFGVVAGNYFTRITHYDYFSTNFVQITNCLGIIRIVISYSKKSMAKNAVTKPAVKSEAYSDKSFLVAVLLSVLVGGLGIDRFYLGYVGLGVLKLLTLGGCGVWTIIDIILIVTGNLPDAQGKKLNTKS